MFLCFVGCGLFLFYGDLPSGSAKTVKSQVMHNVRPIHANTTQTHKTTLKSQTPSQTCKGSKSLSSREYTGHITSKLATVQMQTHVATGHKLTTRSNSSTTLPIHKITATTRTFLRHSTRTSTRAHTSRRATLPRRVSTRLINRTSPNNTPSRTISKLHTARTTTQTPTSGTIHMATRNAHSTKNPTHLTKKTTSIHRPSTSKHVVTRSPQRVISHNSILSLRTRTSIQSTAVPSRGVQVGRPALYQNEYLKEHSNRIFIMAQCPLPHSSTLTAFELYTGGCVPTGSIYLLIFALPLSTSDSLSASTGHFDASIVSVTRVDPVIVPSTLPGSGHLRVPLSNSLHLQPDSSTAYLLGFAFDDEHCGAIFYSSFANPYVLPEALVYSTPIIKRVADNVTVGARVSFSGTPKLHAEFSINVWLIRGNNTLTAAFENLI